MPTKSKAPAKAVAAEPAAPKAKGIVLMDKREAQRIHEEAQRVDTSVPAWANPNARFGEDNDSIDARLNRLHRSRSNT